MLWSARAWVGYVVARRLMRWTWLVRQPVAWRWMEGQFARKAALGDVSAQSFYGHVLLHRGQGLGARAEGLRLLQLAASAGDGKSAYQLGVLSLAGDTRQAPDAKAAAAYWQQAATAGHPLAAQRLAQLYQQGGQGLAANPEQAARFQARAAELGL
jgi:TPR repeat protein